MVVNPCQPSSDCEDSWHLQCKTRGCNSYNFSDRLQAVQNVNSEWYYCGQGIYYSSKEYDKCSILPWNKVYDVKLLHTFDETFENFDANLSEPPASFLIFPDCEDEYCRGRG